MQIHELKAPYGAHKRRRIVGRGPGSGRGKTSGRGQKGQKARSGRGILGGLEGGQMPLIRRLPKVGFRSKRPILYQLVSLSDLSKFKEGSVVDAKVLKDNGMIKNIFRPFKVLGEGEIKKALTIHAYSFSGSAAEKIKKAGGTTQTIDQSFLKKSQSKEEAHTSVKKK